MSTLYKQVSNQILAQIANGSRKVGDRLPPEEEFASELGISRSTLRLAFRELETCGVLRRRKKIGTEIIAAEPQLQLVLGTSSIHDIIRIVRTTALNIDSISQTNVDDVSILKPYRSESEHWLEVFGSRSLTTDSTPFCTNRIYVPERYADIECRVHEPNTSVFLKIEAKYGVAMGQVKNQTNAVSCPELEAALIGVEVGSPVLQTDAAYLTHDGELIEFVVTIYNSERFQMQSDFSIE